MSHPLLSAKALEIGHFGKRLLAPIDVEFRRGEFWCVLGRNGAGKTTLVRTLLGLLPPIAGTRITEKNLRLGYLPQKAHFDELYPMSARDVVLMGTDRQHSFLKRRSADASELCESALEAMKVSSVSHVRYRDLSEGQKQRVLLARLSAGRPSLAFLDEPTTAMDRPGEERAFLHMAQQCVNHQTCMVVVTHDFLLARKYADHALFVDDSKRLVLAGPVEQVLSSDELKQRFSVSGRRSEP